MPFGILKVSILPKMDEGLKCLETTVFEVTEDVSILPKMDEGLKSINI